MKKYMIILILFNSLPYYSISQATLYPSFSASFSIPIQSTRSKSAYEFRISGGVNSKFNISSWAYYTPSVNLALALGAIGRDYFSNCNIKQRLIFDLIVAPVNVCIGSHSINENSTYYLYNFNSNFSLNHSLQNKYLLQIGSNLIYSYSKEKQFFQRVGQFQIRINNLQFGYYNDGGPVYKQLYLGDGKDRYHTGGGYLMFIADNIKNNNLNIGWEFNKFTGHIENAFEVLRILGFEQLALKDNESKYISGSNKLFINYSTSNNYANIFIDFKDSDFDVQDYIHKYISKDPTFSFKKFPSTYIGLNLNNYVK